MTTGNDDVSGSGGSCGAVNIQFKRAKNDESTLNVFSEWPAPDNKALLRGCTMGQKGVGMTYQQPLPLEEFEEFVKQV
ncbi:MAG TPA: hypothetical protein DEQ40_15420 [Oxalobacteraceae bacterium]|jgi:hypothetical protein|nr:hypothetical protein [Oxalobacteraceae bacterium]